MDTQPRNHLNPAPTNVAMNLPRAAFAELVAATLLHVYDSGAAVVLANGSEELQCNVGAPASESAIFWR